MPGLLRNLGNIGRPRPGLKIPNGSFKEFCLMSCRSVRGHHAATILLNNRLSVTVACERSEFSVHLQKRVHHQFVDYYEAVMKGSGFAELLVDMFLQFPQFRVVVEKTVPLLDCFSMVGALDRKQVRHDAPVAVAVGLRLPRHHPRSVVLCCIP